MKKRPTDFLVQETKRIQADREALASELILAFFLLCAVFLSLRDLMWGWEPFLGAVLSGAIVLFVRLPAEHRGRRIGVIRTIVFAIGIGLLILLFSSAMNGFLDAVNRLLTLWNHRFGTEARTFAVGGNLRFASIVFWTLLGIPLATLLLLLVQRHMAVLATVLVLTSLLFGTILGQTATSLSVLLLAFCLLGSLIFFSAPGRIMGWRGGVCLLLGIPIALGMFGLTHNYNGSADIAEWRRDFVSWVERVRYGEDSLPKGNLRTAHRLLGDGEDTLTLEMDKDQELYLRGYVGGVYEGDHWEELPSEDYQGDYEGLMDWLYEQRFLPVTQYAAYYKLDRALRNGETDYTKVKVTNVGAYRKYAYLPGTATGWSGSGIAQKKDWQVQSGQFLGVPEYQFRMVSHAPTAETAVLEPWPEDILDKEAEKFLDAEAVYHSFVEDFYLEISDEQRDLMNEIFFPDGSDMDFAETTAQIRRVLRSSTKYDGAPGKLPGGEDFLEWFLRDSRSGNDVHYASAAVMAYRAAGYPARYVEGYHYVPKDTDGGARKATLTSADSHAWAEVYLTGAGWLPVETVPGMYTEVYSNQKVEGRPSYQVNSRQEEDGLDVESGESAADAGDSPDEKKTMPVTLRRVLAAILLCLYGLLAVFLLLELQRYLRIRVRRRALSGKDGRSGNSERARRLFLLLESGGVSGNYGHLMGLSGQIPECFPGVSGWEYERAVSLLQKVTFGGSALLPHEEHALDCCLDKMENSLYRRSSLAGKFRLRYLDI